MDNPLTPKKIQKLMNFAEGKTNNIDRLLLSEEDLKLLASYKNSEYQSRSPVPRYESSSGIIDLDHVEGFGESCSSMGNVSLAKSTAFNPAEMTGRSTGAGEALPSLDINVAPAEIHGRHSIGIDSITSHMYKQTNEIHEFMRHSMVSNNFSFHSKRDLTADEASLIQREAPLPVMHTTQTYFSDTMSANSSNLSVGAYFRNRCLDFGKILGKTDSPDRSYMMPSITEVSGNPSDLCKVSEVMNIDNTLDTVPVRQSRNPETFILEKSTTSSRTGGFDKNAEKLDKSKHVFKEPAEPRSVEKSALTTSAKHKIPEKTQENLGVKNVYSSKRKSYAAASNPASLLIKKMQECYKEVAEDTADLSSSIGSFSISKIADYLGKESNVSVTHMMQLQKRPAGSKHPLTELNMNAQKEELPVLKLIDSKKAETASSAGTIQTVISSVDKLKLKNPPEVMITCPSEAEQTLDEPKHTTRNKSPSGSPSTLSTVRDCSSYKSGDTPNSSEGIVDSSKPPSPTLAYTELDKSVDWQAVYEQKNLNKRAVAKDQWIQVEAEPVDGFVGLSTAVTILATALTDTWLTAKFQFNSLPYDGKYLNIELPRLPLLLSPGKSEKFTFYITTNVEMKTLLPFSFIVKDAAIDAEVEQKGELKVNFKVPVIRAMCSDGTDNNILYPAVQEKAAVTKSFVLVSDCPADLQLKLAITEGDSMYSIKNVQEIKKSDVNKVLLERQESEDLVKPRAKPMCMQLCRLDKDSAIRVSITFKSPKLDMKLFGPNKVAVAYNGVLTVTLIGGSTVLKKVDLLGLLGIPRLHVDIPGNKIQVTNEPTKITVENRGTVCGTWSVRCQHRSAGFPFEITPTRFGLAPEKSQTLQVVYKNNTHEGIVETLIHLEELTTGEITNLILRAAATDKPKSFPIKSNTHSLSWVRAGRKEVSLKNNTDKKVYIRCHIVGEGFSIDLPGDARGIYVLPFNGRECRPLPINFAPNSSTPHSATLHMAPEKSSDTSRKITLFGCVSGEPIRWSGLVTYSDTAALVRATSRAPIDLKLHNKANTPAFIAAKVHFNLQYMQLEPFCQLVGSNKIVPGRSFHTISLRLDWPRVERRARESTTTALATITVLTGAESTRRRILKILKNESKENPDTSLLPEHLRVLARQFDGEDDSADSLFAEFNENKGALAELIHDGLQELTANVDLPQDLPDENTIIITDDTIVDHHTLCE